MKPKPEPSALLVVRVPEKMMKRIDRYGRNIGANRSAAVRELLQRSLGGRTQ